MGTRYNIVHNYSQEKPAKNAIEGKNSVDKKKRTLWAYPLAWTKGLRVAAKGLARVAVNIALCIVVSVVWIHEIKRNYTKNWMKNTS